MIQKHINHNFTKGKALSNTSGYHKSPQDAAAKYLQKVKHQHISSKTSPSMANTCLSMKYPFLCKLFEQISMLLGSYLPNTCIVYFQPTFMWRYVHTD